MKRIVSIGYLAVVSAVFMPPLLVLAFACLLWSAVFAGFLSVVHVARLNDVYNNRQES